MWMAEALWEASLSPWKRVRDVRDAEVRRALTAARSTDAAALDSGRSGRAVYRRAWLYPAVAAARSSALAARATRTESRTGVPAGCGQERPRRGVSKTDGGSSTAPAPSLLRAFCLGAFVHLGRALEEGDDLPFAFEEHAQRGGLLLPLRVPPSRPLLRRVARASWRRCADRARGALARAGGDSPALTRGRGQPRSRRLSRTVLLAPLISTAEGCGGFDWDDVAFERAYGELERSLFGTARAYAAVAPIVGISVVTEVQLGGGILARAAATGELAHHWPEAQGLLPHGASAARPTAIAYSSPSATSRQGRSRPTPRPSSPTPSPRSGSRPPRRWRRGPVLFERLDWRPFGIRPVLPIAATQPPGEPTRLDSFRAELTRELLDRPVLADADPALAEALDRWELSLFQHEPFGRSSCAGRWPGCSGRCGARAAVLLGEESEERRAIHAALRASRWAARRLRRAEATVRRCSSRRSATASARGSSASRRCCSGSARGSPRPPGRSVSPVTFS